MGGYIKSELSVMMLDEGLNRSIRGRFICDWFRVDSYVSNKDGLISEIERNMPDVVVMDLELYARIPNRYFILPISFETSKIFPASFLSISWRYPSILKHQKVWNLYQIHDKDE